MSLLKWSVQPTVSQGKKRKLLVLESAEGSKSFPQRGTNVEECFTLQSGALHDAAATVSNKGFSGTDIPNCWSSEQMLMFLQKNTWLVVKNKKLGCSACKALKSMKKKIPRSQGSRFSLEWTKCAVTSYGSDKSKQQQSLRKKIREHKESITHKTAIQVEKEKSQGSVLDEEKTMCRMLHAVYNIGKERLPFVDMMVDLDVQQINRIKMDHYFNTEPCVDIIDHIASDVRKRLVMDIVEKKNLAPQREGDVEECSNLQSRTVHNLPTSTSAEEVLDADIPDCWSIEQMVMYCQKNTWLVFKNKKLGCSACKALKSVENDLSQGPRFSLEWTECAVTCCGKDKRKQHQSLCKKIDEHSASNIHKTAMQVKKEMSQGSICVGEETTTFRVFRTIYNIGEGPPLVDMRVDLNVPQMKSLEMAPGLQTTKSCVDIIDHIASDVRERLVKGIVENKSSAPQSDRDFGECSNLQSRKVPDITTSASTEEMLDADIPDCWSIEQMLSFCQKNTWLVIKNKKLGCSACKALKSMDTVNSQSSRVSVEWLECGVACYGNDKGKQQQSLRKKIREHKESNTHKTALRVEKKPFQGFTPVEEVSPCHVFCTLFNIGEEGRPFVNLMADLDVQQVNGLKMSQGHNMGKSCADVKDHIVSDVSKGLVKEVLKNKSSDLQRDSDVEGYPRHFNDILENQSSASQIGSEMGGCPRTAKDIDSFLSGPQIDSDVEGCPKFKRMMQNKLPAPESDSDDEGFNIIVKDNSSPDPQSDSDNKGCPRLKDVLENTSPDPQHDNKGCPRPKDILENTSPDPQSDSDGEGYPIIVKDIEENASPNPQHDNKGCPRPKDILENTSPDPQSDSDGEGYPIIVKDIEENASPNPQHDNKGCPRPKDILENTSPDPQSDSEGYPIIVKDIEENASPDSQHDIKGCPRPKDIWENTSPDPQSDSYEGCPKPKNTLENTSSDPQSDSDDEEYPIIVKDIVENASPDPQSDGDNKGCSRLKDILVNTSPDLQVPSGVAKHLNLQTRTVPDTTIVSTKEMLDADIPDCWSIEQMLMFCKKNTWLIIKNKKLRCSACSALKSVENRKSNGSRVSVEWTERGVTCYGNDKIKQQQSLRKKISEHSESNSHKTAMQVQKETSRGCVPVGEKKMTWHVLRTVYDIGKRVRPFVDMIDVQMNRIKKARDLHTEPCVDVVDHIAADVRKRLNISSVSQCDRVVECSSLQSKTIHDIMSSTTNQEIDEADIPDCWTIEQVQRFCRENTWLIIQKKKMGCSACKALRSMETHKSLGSRVTVEWAECGMTCYGKDKSKQQQSLRKKIREHKESITHKTAIQMQKEISQGCTPIGDKETTCRVFRTVYNIGKQGRPLVDMTADINVQQMNGLKMGRVLHTGKSGADIIDHIASDMRKRLVEDIVENKRKVSLLIDDSTTFSGKSVIVLCLRAAIAKESDVQTFFFDLLELDSTTASEIVATLVECLHGHGFHEEFLQECLIAVSCDGASAKLGRHVGVAAQLQDHYPGLFAWHCSSHRLELAVGEVIKKNSGLDHFQIFFDKLYSLYNHSPEVQWEVSVYANEVEQCLLEIGHRFSIDWVTSHEKCVKAVWQSFSALHQYFSIAALDLYRDSRLRAKMACLDKMLTSCAFLKNMGILFDALVELNDFARQVDNPDLTLPDADELLTTTINVLESMANIPFPYTEEANQACESLSFEGIKLHDRYKSPVIQSGEFFRSLSENLKVRLATRDNSYDSIYGHIRSKNSKTFIEQVKLLYPENWPENVAMDKEFGDKGVRKLCQTLQVNVKDSVRGFQEYKECKATRIPADFKPLLKAIETIPVSTSECQRSLRCMNDLMTAKRSSLAIPRLSSLLFLKLVGPPVGCFDPLPYVKTWLEQGRRSADEVACRKIKQEAETSPFESLWTLF